MIITKLQGGLGNQMFQYATARSLAIKNKTTLKLDIQLLLDETPYENFTPRKYELGIFNIEQNFAQAKEINRFYRASKFNLIKQIRNKVAPCNYISEPHFHFSESILSVKSNAYLDGYWQSEKYFEDIRHVLLGDFKIITPLSVKNLELTKVINNTESVSIHVRRGDYMSNKTINETHGICSMEYYNSAISYIASKIEHPTFFIFSDDIPWVKNYMNYNYNVIYVDHNSPDMAYEDLRLMSLCKHNIIGNSSFSWWGAWLNPNKDKIVIAPKQWFATTERSSIDIIPEGWIKL